MCVPGASEEVVIDAVPFGFRVAEPSVVPPSLNCTLPVGAGPLLLATVAVNVTALPTVRLALEEASWVWVTA